MLYTWRTNHHAYATDMKMSRGQEKQGPAGGSIMQGVTYMQEVTGTGAIIEGLIYQESSKLYMAEIQFKLKHKGY